ncbi:MAG: hypothetical protein WHT06_03170 [Desulfobacterales bacterium]
MAVFIKDDIVWKVLTTKGAVSIMKVRKEIGLCRFKDICGKETEALPNDLSRRAI